MCQGDTTIVPLRWGSHPIPRVNFSVTHECKNWGQVTDWVKSNTVDIFADGMLVHPKWGKSASLFPLASGTERLTAASSLYILNPNSKISTDGVRAII
jgi:Mycotoxin biosynthesis protein UstYa